MGATKMYILNIGRDRIFPLGQKSLSFYTIWLLLPFNVTFEADKGNLMVTFSFSDIILTFQFRQNDF